MPVFSQRLTWLIWRLEEIGYVDEKLICSNGKEFLNKNMTVSILNIKAEIKKWIKWI